MTDIMLDIETLSVHPTNSVVLSIGAVEFTLLKNRPSFGANVLLVLNLNEQIADGRGISVRTLDFWAEQPAAAKEHWRSA